MHTENNTPLLLLESHNWHPSAGGCVPTKQSYPKLGRKNKTLPIMPGAFLAKHTVTFHTEAEIYQRAHVQLQYQSLIIWGHHPLLIPPQTEINAFEDHSVVLVHWGHSAVCMYVFISEPWLVSASPKNFTKSRSHSEKLSWCDPGHLTWIHQKGHQTARSEMILYICEYIYFGYYL